MSASAADVLRIVESTGVVAVIRLADSAGLIAAAHALADGGVRALEVTMTVPGAVALIRELAASLPAEFAVGAGTVLDGETARQVIEAGARFIVSPVLRPDVIATAHRYGAAVMPGCFTPTEILSSWWPKASSSQTTVRTPRPASRAAMNKPPGPPPTMRTSTDSRIRREHYKGTVYAYKS